ncbi:unnamed protein product [Didymodactylos carnosus]|uniref:Uncharacterized protein n=1 Tax=Didymodactylos carnosus TaxID=1234261 RepID=A0A814YAT9_9BILA|nr:unnamed protein product [Didymodactylos carnosus]CAF1226729.1 unnamed protein product [Didymodactylos carnosus]CAF3803515.1 unnamed protein product [Didymodactylos carnosus]CAF3989670.1 unnamed protein product [Didymodactylos carnosus]
MPVISILVCLALGRLIINKIELLYHNRKKHTNRRISTATYKTGRLVLPYTPIAPNELQRILQGDYATNRGNRSLRGNDVLLDQLNRKQVLPSPSNGGALASLILGQANSFMSIMDVGSNLNLPGPETDLNVTNDSYRSPQYMSSRRALVEKTSINPAVQQQNRNSDVLDLYYIVSEQEINTRVGEELTYNFLINVLPIMSPLTLEDKNNRCEKILPMSTRVTDL